MDQQSIKKTLENHYSNQAYKPEDHYPNVVNVDGRYLGPYIPYVGERYFDSRPKLLIYAMAQNLARTPNLISNWLDNDDHGLLRHYYHSDSLWLSLNPYDTGHLKVIAALASTNYPGTDYQPSDNIHKRIAITNFVKFSFFFEGKKLIRDQKYNSIDDISLIQTITRGTPDSDGKIAKAIRTDWYYFKKMETYFKNALSA